MLVGGLLEFILGKTFPFVVSMSFGKLNHLLSRQRNVMEDFVSHRVWHNHRQLLPDFWIDPSAILHRLREL